MRHKIKLGFRGYVTRYFLGVGLLAIQTIVIEPVGVFFAYLLNPCMPPAFMSMALFPCSGWSDAPKQYWANFILAMFGAYFGALVSSTSVFAMIVLLVYPVEIQLLLLKEFKR